MKSKLGQSQIFWENSGIREIAQKDQKNLFLDFFRKSSH